jgi:tetratricopeptide (TPR) repeat protein/DNA-binding XRE family transcriptional regulator
MDTNNDHPLRQLRERLNFSIDDLAEASGVSARTILRAEQGHGLYPGSRRQLCDYLQKSPEELGLQAASLTRKLLGISLSGSVHTSIGIDDMKRRELLRLLGIAGSALVLELDWERIGDALAQPMRIDTPALQELATLNRQYWQNYRAASQKSVILDDVLAHLGALIQALRDAQTASQRQQLGALASDLAQLSGEIFFDASLYVDAAQCYTFAASAAKEVKAYDLWACALVRHAFLPIFDRHFQDALPVLQAAEKVAQHGDGTLTTRHWVAMVSAGAYAGSGMLNDCRQALDLAESVRGVRYGMNGTWLRFDGERILEERGACFVKLGQADLAEPVLQEALLHHSSPTRRRGMVLSDLALASVMHGEVERACTLGNEVIQIAQLGSSGVLKKGLHVLQTQLSPFAKSSVVKDLNTQIRLLA